MSDNASIHSTFEFPRLSTVHKVALISTLDLAFITASMSIQATNLAMPTIQRDLDIAVGDLQWLSGAYNLTYGAFLLLFGRLADVHGSKFVFLSATLWFLASSVACALAPSGMALFIFRGCQGVGAAAITPAMFGILGRTFAPGVWKTAAFAAFSAGAPLGGTVGVLVGGFMTETTAATWRSFFYFNVGLCAALMVMGFFVIPPDIPPEQQSHRKSSVDWFGGGLIAAGLILLCFALADSSSAPDGWKTPYIYVLLVVGVLFVLFFVWWEMRLEEKEKSGGAPPLMRCSLFKRGRFSWVQIAASLVWAAFIDLGFFTTQYFQNYLGLSAIQTALRFLPMSAVGLTLNFVVGFAAPRVPAQILFTIGCVGTTLSCLLFAIIEPSASYWTYAFFSVCLSVFGADFVFSTGIMYGSKVARSADQAVAGGIYQTLTQIASVIGLAICTIAQVSATQRRGREDGIDVLRDLTNAPREAQLYGLRAAFWTCFACGALATLLAAVFLRGMGYVGMHHGPQEALPKDEENGSRGSVPHQEKVEG